MDNRVVLKVENLKKKYRLGIIGSGSLRADVQSLISKLRGKDDPNLCIDQERQVGKTFYALKGISFEVKEGERVGIIGGNGAGKSTTLKILSHVTSPSDGTVRIRGRISSMLEVGTGFHPELTGRENIYLNGAILGMSKTEIDRKIEDIIEFSECAQFIDTPVKRYSSGMYVKLAFSVAAHLDSEILIMDEVLAVGDMKFQNKCLNKMKSLANDDHRTVLYVSHNMNTVRQLCNRCIVMDHGTIVYDGEVEKAISLYMGHNSSKQTTYSYRDRERTKKNPEFEFLTLKIQDNSDCVYERGENVNLLFTLRARQRIDGYGVRFEIYNAEGRIIGTSFSDQLYSVRSEELVELMLEMNTDSFSPGEYYVDALTYSQDGSGNQSFCDRVSPAFVFEIVDTKSDLIWLKKFWGDIELDPLKTISMKSIDRQRD